MIKINIENKFDSSLFDPEQLFDENTIIVNNETIQGIFSQYEYNNIIVNISKSHSFHDFLVSEKHEKTFIVLNFLIDGRMDNYLFSEKHIEFNKGVSAFFLVKDSGKVLIPGNRTNTFVSILLTPEKLFSLLGANFAMLPEQIKAVLEKGVYENRILDNRKYNSQIQLILHQIIHNPYKGSLKKVYLEAKVLELIVARLSELFHDHEKKGPDLKLRKNEIDSIHFAKEYILKHYHNPPGISQLARMAGINEYKLKNGFKKVFGNTVFGLLREYRLEQARLLLLERDKNITEIAMKVGYNNPSHFASLFKQKYGISPGKLQS